MSAPPSRTPSHASARSTASKSSAKPGPAKTAPSRPSTPDIKGSLEVPMGGIGWLAANGSASTLIVSVGGTKKTVEDKNDWRGLFTRGLTACFAVVVMGKEGAIMAHVTAYLGHEPLPKQHQPELKAMKDGFASLWKKHPFDIKAARVMIIDGPNTTNKEQRDKLVAHIFPQLAKLPKSRAACETSPPGGLNEHHGTVLMVHGKSGTELFVGGKREM